jgi:hypothetical protein
MELGPFHLTRQGCGAHVHHIPFTILVKVITLNVEEGGYWLPHLQKWVKSAWVPYLCKFAQLCSKETRRQGKFFLNF